MGGALADCDHLSGDFRDRRDGFDAAVKAQFSGSFSSPGGARSG